MFTLLNKKIKLPSTLVEILENLQLIGAHPIVVGGCVRDSLLNIPCKDYDVELFNVEKLEDIQKVLEKFGSVKLVGKSFGVLTLRVDDLDLDFALSRIEKKIASGHRGFEVTTKKDLSYEEASIRRDFTINSIGYDFFEDKILDPHDGLKDLEKKLLRHIKDETFVEDPLRVYRAVQFCSRFELQIDSKTFELCKKMVDENRVEELPRERIYEEFKKIFLKSSKPSLAFELLKNFGILKYFTELEKLIGCEQEYEYHPEGDVWVHTLMVIDEMAKLVKEKKIEDEFKILVLFFASLCHDLGKPFCTKVINGKITSHKHEALGVEPTISFMKKLTDDKKLIDEVVTLVQYHLAPFQLYFHNSSNNAVKRLSLKANLETLSLVCLADCLGRDIKDKCKCYDAIEWLNEKVKELELDKDGIKPLILGRDLITLGYKPNKEFKEILEFAFDLQIDFELSKEEILKRVLKKFPS